MNIKVNSHEFVENSISEIQKIVDQQFVDVIHLGIILPLTMPDDILSAEEISKEVNHQIWTAIALGFELGKIEGKRKHDIKSFFQKLFGKTK